MDYILWNMDLLFKITYTYYLNMINLRYLNQ